MQVLRPAPHVLAFYDGREPGLRFSAEPNWVDRGALTLGIASYAILYGDEALVYDTHVSVDRAAAIRRALEAAGAERITVLLSHWHLDHVAGNAAFADCEILASERTAEHLAGHREAIEAGALEGPPAVAPLVPPTRTLAGDTTVRVGGIELELLQVDVHSDDATVVWWPEPRILLAGDTLEDTLTYVDEPRHLERHLADLDRLRRLGPERILPNHGAPERVAHGGYPAGLIDATEDYVRFLLRCREEPDLRDTPLREVLARSLAHGWLSWFEPYTEIHAENLATVLGSGGASGESLGADQPGADRDRGG